MFSRGTSKYVRHEGGAVEDDDKDVLTRQQVNNALMTIEDMHPMRDRANIEHVIPFIKMCLCKKRKPDFKHAMRAVMLDEMGIKIPKSEK